MPGKRANGEGSIYQMKDGRWAAAVTLQGKRSVRYGRSRAEAGGKLTDMLSRNKSSLPVIPERATLGEWLKRWLTDIAKPGTSPGTYRQTETICRNHLIPDLGHFRLAKLTASDVQRFLNAKVKTELSTRYISHMRATLRNALNVAVRFDLVTRNVAELAIPPRIVEPEREPWTVEEARRFLAFTKDDRLYALYVLALCTGCRQGELLGARWPDLDVDGKKLQLRTNLQRVEKEYQLLDLKTRQSRKVIPLPDLAMAALRAHRIRQAEERLKVGQAWRNDNDLIFTTTRGTPLNGSTITHRVQKQAPKAQVPVIRFHDIRHTTGAFLVDIGAEQRVIMEYLRHTQMSTSARYSHVREKVTRDAADRLGALLAGES